MRFDEEPDKYLSSAYVFNISAALFFFAYNLDKWYIKELFIIINGEYIVMRLVFQYFKYAYLFHAILVLFSVVFYNIEKSKKMLFLNIWLQKMQ